MKDCGLLGLELLYEGWAWKHGNGIWEACAAHGEVGKLGFCNYTPNFDEFIIYMAQVEDDSKVLMLWNINYGLGFLWLESKDRVLNGRIGRLMAWRIFLVNDT